jgi:hypothetical protein
MAQEKRGYALKTERGERPFLYSAEHQTWRAAVDRFGGMSAPADDARRAWSRRFGMWPVRKAGVEA